MKCCNSDSRDTGTKVGGKQLGKSAPCLLMKPPPAHRLRNSFSKIVNSLTF
jgi:hypothetical protein